MFGAIGVDCSSSRRVLRDVLVAWMVLSAVFRVFSCCSMKLFEWCKCGDEMM